jgi:hypothetical protein
MSGSVFGSEQPDTGATPNDSAGYRGTKCDDQLSDRRDGQRRRTGGMTHHDDRAGDAP